MRHVAFFRNLNQGQRNNPTSEQVAAAMSAAGASSIRLVRSNGTVVFEVADVRDATGCADAAAAALAAVSGWSDLVFVRPIEWVAEILTFVNAAEDDPRQLELTVFDETLTPDRPLTGPRCAVVQSGPGFAIILNEFPRESHGTPTLERALGTKATSRGLATVRMVVR